jgi:hypothetical protein
MSASRTQEVLRVNALRGVGFGSVDYQIRRGAGHGQFDQLLGDQVVGDCRVEEVLPENEVFLEADFSGERRLLVHFFD